MHDLRDRSRDAQRLGSRAYEEIRRPSSRKINVVCGRVVESILVNVSGDANDRRPARLGIQRTQIDAFPDRVALRPEPPSHGFIDDRGVLQLEIILSEKAPRAQRNSQRRKISQAHGAKLRDRSSSAGWYRLPFDDESRGLAQFRPQRQIIDSANISNAR